MKLFYYLVALLSVLPWKYGSGFVGVLRGRVALQRGHALQMTLDKVFVTKLDNVLLKVRDFCCSIICFHKLLVQLTAHGIQFADVGHCGAN